MGVSGKVNFICPYCREINTVYPTGTTSKINTYKTPERCHFCDRWFMFDDLMAVEQDMYGATPVARFDPYTEPRSIWPDDDEIPDEEPDWRPVR